MRRVLVIALAVLAVAAGLALPAARAADPAALGATPEEQHAAAVELGRLAYTYGFPLTEFLRVRATETSVTVPDARGDAPLNTLSNALPVADPANRTVVAPNIDTAYSIAQLDLGQEPVVLKVPPMHGRYWVFELLDPYTNVIGYIGQRLDGSKGGTWAIAWPGARRTKVPLGMRRFRSPYRRVWVIGRTLHRGPRDLAAVRAIQRRYVLEPLSLYRSGRRAPSPRTRVTRPTLAPALGGLPFLAQLGRGLADNPPPARDRAVLARLAGAGIGPGLDPGAEGLPQPVLDGLAEGVDAAARDIPAGARAGVLAGAQAHGGWFTADRHIGAYGTDYLLRAQIAAVGLGANTPAESVYPTALTDARGRLLDGANRYRLTFEKPPPARAFWSLTMYDINGYLVDTPTGIYAVGDSHPPLRRRPDGSIVIAIQRDRPAERDVNWLPAPAGPFRMSLRLYTPSRSILTGAWRPPPIERLG